MSARRLSRRSRPLAVAAVAAALLLPLAACSDDDDETTTEGTSGASSSQTSATSETSETSGPTSSPTTGSSGSTTPEPTVEGIDPMDDAGTDPVSATAQVSGTALITDVRVARHEGYDRVVFEFENGLPGYQVGYVEGPITQDASGEPVDVQGAAYLQVRMEPASIVDLSGEAPRQTYDGPMVVDGDTPEVTEVVNAGDFEAVSTWVIGVTDPGVAFRVQVLTSPARLVVDVQNH